MAIYGYTKNYKLIKPQFNTDTWHDYIYDNLDTIDAVMSAIYASGNWKGFWATNTVYTIGDVIIDQDTDTMYKVMVDHTTSEATFAEEFAAHPTYYELWSPNNLAEDWAIKMDGEVSNVDYSSKAYAISSELIDDGSAKEWAIKTGGSIGTTGEYSAKKYATDAHNDYISMTTDANVVAVGTNIANVNAVGLSISDVNTVASDISSVNTLAGISTDVTTVASIATAVSTVSGIESEVLDVSDNRTDISTVASNISDVNSVASNEANINAVAGNSANINAVNANKTNIDTVAGDKTNIDKVASDIASVRVTSNYISDVTTVAFDITNVNTVAGISSDVTAVAGVSSYMATVAGLDTEIVAVAGNATNINTVAAIGSDVTTVASISADVSTVAGNNANVTTVATNISDVNTAVANMADIQAAPTAASNAAASASNSQVWAEGTDEQVQALGGVHSSKGWAEQSTNANVDLSNLSATGNDKFVTKDTTQTITGIKTINTGVSFQNMAFKVPDLASNATIPSADIWKWNAFTANDGSAIGINGVQVSSTGSRFYTIARKTVNGTELSAYISTWILNDGTIYVELPASPSSATDNSTRAATTAWVNTANKTGYGIGAPNYAAYQSITLNSNKQFTATENGYIRAVNANGVTLVISGCTVAYTTSGTSNTMFPIAKGQTLTASSAVSGLLFIPCLG